MSMRVSELQPPVPLVDRPLSTTPKTKLCNFLPTVLSCPPAEFSIKHPPKFVFFYQRSSSGGNRNPSTDRSVMGHFATVLSYLHSFAGPTLMLLYPLYASIQAIESPSKLDDEQWLAYWILYSFLTLFEMVAQPILEWVPAWYHIRLILAAWLVLPQFRGAAFVYEKFVRERLRKFGGGAASSSSPNSKDKHKNKFVAFVTPKKADHEAY